MAHKDHHYKQTNPFRFSAIEKCVNMNKCMYALNSVANINLGNLENICEFHRNQNTHGTNHFNRYSYNLGAKYMNAFYFLRKQRNTISDILNEKQQINKIIHSATFEIILRAAYDAYC